MISASALERLANCPTSYVLPPIYETSLAAAKGTTNHEQIALQVLAYRDLGHLPTGPLGNILNGATVLAVEHSFVLDVTTEAVRSLGEGVGRDYGTLKANDIACTVDVVLRDAAGLVTVIDWKSSSYGDTTASANNWQLKVQALCVSLWLGADTVQAGLCYLDTWEQDVTRFDSFRLAELCTQVLAASIRVSAAKASDPVRLGPWCRYCPAQYTCPGRAAIAKAGMAVAGLPEGTDYGDAWAALGAAADAISAAREVIKERAKHAPIQLAGGKRLTAVESRRSSVDSAKLDAILLERGIEKPVREIRIVQVREVGQSLKKSEE